MYMCMCIYIYINKSICIYIYIYVFVLSGNKQEPPRNKSRNKQLIILSHAHFPANWVGGLIGTRFRCCDIGFVWGAPKSYLFHQSSK